MALVSVNDEILRRILLFYMVAESARSPHWYTALALACTKVWRTIDDMLQDPEVLEQITFWDRSKTEAQEIFLNRITERGLRMVKRITIRSAGGDGAPYLSNSRFSRLQHLTLEGASSDQLNAYLRALGKQLTHLTTDCVMGVPTALDINCWPKSVTLVNPVSSECILICLVVVAWTKGLQRLQMCPATDQLTSHLFQAVCSFQALCEDTNVSGEKVDEICLSLGLCGEAEGREEIRRMVSVIRHMLKVKEPLVMRLLQSQ